MSAANAKREAPQLKNQIAEKLAKWSKRLIDKAADEGDFDSELVKAYREMVADLEEIKATCDHRGRY